MPNLVWGLIGGLVVGALLAGVGIYLYLKPKTDAVYKQAEEDIANRKNQAELEAQNLVRDAQNESRQTRQEPEAVDGGRRRPGCGGRDLRSPEPS